LKKNVNNGIIKSKDDNNDNSDNEDNDNLSTNSGRTKSESNVSGLQMDKILPSYYKFMGEGLKKSLSDPSMTSGD